MTSTSTTDTTISLLERYGLGKEKLYDYDSDTESDTSAESFHSMVGGVRVYKIVMLGDGGVGKSAVTMQFVTHSFLESHDPTIEDSYQKQVVLDGVPALLDILDTAGQIEFTAMREQYMRAGEGFLICYSVTDRHSFQEALEYHRLVQQVRQTKNVPVVLVGNKYDLQMQRKVTTEEGRLLARQLNCPFYETSAALRTYIEDSFLELVREIRLREKRRHLRRARKNNRWWRLRSALAVAFQCKNKTIRHSH